MRCAPMRHALMRRASSVPTRARACSGGRWSCPVSDAAISGAVNSAVGSIERLRLIGKIEGVSYLLLLGVAMPLKYLAGLPLAVKLVGWAHGVLFVAFLFALGLAMLRARLTLKLALSVFIASLLPFGPFVVDRRLDEFARSGRGAR